MMETYASLNRTAVDWITEIWQPGDLSGFERLHAPDFIDHSAAEGRGSDRAAYRAGIEALYAAFPDFTTLIEDLVVDPAAGLVAVRWSAAGTHRGIFMEMPPTGRVIDVRGIEVIAVSGGQITARWGEWDLESLLEQFQMRPGS